MDEFKQDNSIGDEDELWLTSDERYDYTFIRRLNAGGHILALLHNRMIRTWRYEMKARMEFLSRLPEIDPSQIGERIKARRKHIESLSEPERKEYLKNFRRHR